QPLGRRAGVFGRARLPLPPAGAVHRHRRGQAAVHRRQVPPAPEHHAQAMTRRRKILLALLAPLLLVPTGVLYWVATTEAGLRFALDRVRKVGPVVITTRDVRGTLVDGIEVGFLRVQHRLSDTRVEGASGRISLWPLLISRQIDVPRLTARRVEVILLEDDSPPRQGEPRFLPPMLRIDADAVRVEEVALTLRNGRELLFRNVSGGVTLVHKRLG